MADILAAISSMFGGGAPSPPQSTVYPAPPLASYPTADDAAFARKNEFSYASPFASFLDNAAANVVGTLQPGGRGQGLVTPQKSSSFGLGAVIGANPPTVRVAPATTGGEVANARDVAMRAALALNRSAIGMLGFNPSKTAIDVSMKSPNLAGAYQPDSDNSLVIPGPDGQFASAMAHESMHRGFQRLREAGSDLPQGMDEEEAVRYLMATRMGDPEKGLGKAGDKQREDGLFTFGIYPNVSAPSDATRPTRNRAAMDALEAKAAQLIYEKQPRGPR